MLIVSVNQRSLYHKFLPLVNDLHYVIHLNRRSAQDTWPPTRRRAPVPGTYTVPWACRPAPQAPIHALTLNSKVPGTSRADEPRCQALTPCPRREDPHHKHPIHTQAIHSQVPGTLRACPACRGRQRERPETGFQSHRFGDTNSCASSSAIRNQDSEGREPGKTTRNPPLSL